MVGFNITFSIIIEDTFCLYKIFYWRYQNIPLENINEPSIEELTAQYRANG